MLDLTEDSILKAIQKIGKNPKLKKGRESIQYDLLHDGEKYPPILVLSEANKLLGGSEVTIRDFSNSTKRAFKLLQEYGFSVVEKDGFYNELIKFLEQSKTSNLKYSHYRNKFLGLDVRVSFGKGNIARIPWISFLADGQTTSNGIYPVYLLFKNINKLILAYGISETNQPNLRWNLSGNVENIKDYFHRNNYDVPERYGSSYVFKAYDVSSLPSSADLDADLRAIILKYEKDMTEQQVSTSPKPKRNKVSFAIQQTLKCLQIYF